eukprot:COSAG05_NODE_9229_length_638_cov_0.660482_1_plen_54_part_10
MNVSYQVVCTVLMYIVGLSRIGSGKTPTDNLASSICSDTVIRCGFALADTRLSA